MSVKFEVKFESLFERLVGYNTVLLLLLLYTDVYTGQPQVPKCGLIGGPVSGNKNNK